LWLDLRSDALMVRREIAYELVEEAVEAGLERHGADFVIATEPVQREGGEHEREGHEHKRTDRHTEE